MGAVRLVLKGGADKKISYGQTTSNRDNGLYIPDGKVYVLTSFINGSDVMSALFYVEKSGSTPSMIGGSVPGGFTWEWGGGQGKYLKCYIALGWPPYGATACSTLLNIAE